MSRGPFIITATGNQFSYWPLMVDDIHIEDIARALSNNCRYNGHLPEGVHYSVAQHSCLVATIVSHELIAKFGPLAHVDDKCRLIIKAALLHDAPEAYLADIPGPLKRGYSAEYSKKDKPHPFLTEGVRLYREYEDELFKVIARRFEIQEKIPPLVDEVDKSIMLPLEWSKFKIDMIDGGIAAAIMPKVSEKYADLNFDPKPAVEAEQEFLELWFSIANTSIVETENPEDIA